MSPNSTDPHSDFYSMEQEIEMCTGLTKQIEDEHGNINGNINTVIDKALF